MSWFFFDADEIEYYLPSFSLVSYVKRITHMSRGGGPKCFAFLSFLDRDPHPTCTRCRVRVCTKDLTCDICKGWSSAQWEAFAKKRSYAERKRSSRPSGSSFPPALKTSPRAGTSSEVTHPASPSSSSSLPASRGASSPPARRVSSERDGSASGCSSGARERASVSSAPSRAEDPGAAHSWRSPVARSAPSSVGSPCSSLHDL